MAKFTLYRPKRGAEPFHTGFASYQAICHGHDPLVEAYNEVARGMGIVLYRKHMNEEGIHVERWHKCDLVAEEVEAQTANLAWADHINNSKARGWFAPANVMEVD